MLGITHVEDLLDITKENILKINIKLEEDPEMRSAYVSALVTSVGLPDLAVQLEEIPGHLQGLPTRSTNPDFD